LVQKLGIKFRRIAIKNFLTALMLLLFFVSFSPVHASEIIDTIDPLLKAGEFEKAQVKIDGFLAEDPKSVDAYMMLGNLRFYEYMSSVPQIELSSNTDESVFVTGIGSIRQATITVPREVGIEVAGHLKTALSLDNSRGDIHKGLSYVFAMALMKDELLSHFLRMKEALPKDEDLPYNMSDYARMLQERGRKDWSLETYGRILELYPGHAGVLSDIAQVYFEEGQMKKAAAAIGRALKGWGVNVRILGSGMLILIISGDHEGGLAAIQRMSDMQGDHVYLVYRGLMKYAEGKQVWRKDLETFAEDNTTGQEAALVAHLLNKEYTGSLEDFMKSDEVVESTWGRLFLYRAGMRRFPDRGAAYMNYAIMMSAYKNYDEALPAFTRAEELFDTLTDDLKEALNLFHAWTLQDSGRTDEADIRWKKILGVETFYASSAAAYFMGKNFYMSGKKDEALEMFLKVSDKASESKYATYARNAVNAINAGREPSFAK
jgi:tetratricopeptide (TPR) repeat protein